MPATVIIGGQWGDEGKGKYTDLFAADSDYAVRFQGGNNAGHTVVPADRGKPIRLHLVPSSIRRSNCTPVIGNGVVVDPEVLVGEVASLGASGFDMSKLKLSANAHLIMPYHKVLDRMTERYLGKNKVGTTKKGIGPAYADKASRIGLRVQDLFDEKILLEKLESILKEKNQILAKVYNQLPEDPTHVAEVYSSLGKKLGPYVCDTSALLNDALEHGARVLLEGAQGTMLDIDHGTYPFVTSSSCTVGGACSGSGVPPKHIDKVVGVVKAYVTRVGSGPFPTEADKKTQEFLVEKGREFGTTTGRRRRCGWFDAVVVRYSSRINGFDEIHLTKVDVLGGMPAIPVAVAYEFSGRRIEELPYHQSEIHHARPVYEELPGWDTDISTVQKPADLPYQVRQFVDFVEKTCKCHVASVSVGPAEDQTVYLD
ncbi:MAG: adenylosuccinate synthase [Acidimicrobiia bacterium]